MGSPLSEAEASAFVAALLESAHVESLRPIAEAGETAIEWVAVNGPRIDAGIVTADRGRE